MKADDFGAVAYAGGVLCVKCLPAGVTPNSDAVEPIFAASEWDSYPICGACGREHDYVGLTWCGEAIAAAIAAGRDR